MLTNEDFSPMFCGRGWKEFLGDDKIVQANLSFSYPGMIRAWHRHNRGQVDYFIVLRETLKIHYGRRRTTSEYGDYQDYILAKKTADN